MTGGAGQLTWRGAFSNAEVNALHAEGFETRVYGDDEWDWHGLTARHGLGWVTARRGGPDRVRDRAVGRARPRVDPGRHGREVGEAPGHRRGALSAPAARQRARPA